MSSEKPDPAAIAHGAWLTHCLLDGVMARQKIKNDAELSRCLRLAPSSISKIRRRRVPVSDEVLLRVHDAFDIPIAELKQLQARQMLLDQRHHLT
ncbi:Cro/C1-type HTH DNA-binding domain-containing protein [Duganella sacchari]|uniref:Cro/C1-type HTH DNA-binding domain-containing protein n=1 Tax=Duganella sacchari TaxID=551987 RepID=A0A1M7KP85_9BURK|nr:helix-turn-helix transcriptional regulator [Duganella sacchari]SHM67265.1 Cro/C1-type HTH DNA-binding domain-containing protein [Duganella sacchari]